MSRSRIVAVILFSLGLVAGAKAESGWLRLKTGMNYGEMVATIGEPLVRSKGREFELWIYDRGAEVVCFRGSVVAWTAPGGVTTIAGRQIDLNAVKPHVEAPVEKAKSAYVPRGEIDYGYQPVSLRRMRLRRL